MQSQNTLVLVVALTGAALFAGFRREAEPVVAPARAIAPVQQTTDDPSDESLPPNHPPIGGGIVPAPPLETNDDTLPPNHPPIDGVTAPDTVPTTAVAPSAVAPSIGWTAPTTWRSVPSASAMRLATYRVPGPAGKADAELTVVHAGGTTEANLSRWVAQFAEATPAKRSEKMVHGLRVWTLEVGGTFIGSGMNANDARGAQRAWMLEGAVIEASDGPYFFKLTGPAATVTAARDAFDALVNSIEPSTE